MEKRAERGGTRTRQDTTLMRGAGLVVLTPEGVRQRSDLSGPLFELRSGVRPRLSAGKPLHPAEEPET